MQLPISD